MKRHKLTSGVLLDFRQAVGEIRIRFVKSIQKTQAPTPESTALTPEQVKAKFKQQGLTFSAWAREHGYRPQEVIRVVNGFNKANYGIGHEIAVKLGLKENLDGSE